jgi:hypothetical protein
MAISSISSSARTELTRSQQRLDTDVTARDSAQRAVDEDTEALAKAQRAADRERLSRSSVGSLIDVTV